MRSPNLKKAHAQEKRGQNEKSELKERKCKVNLIQNVAECFCLYKLWSKYMMGRSMTCHLAEGSSIVYRRCSGSLIVSSLTLETMRENSKNMVECSPSSPVRV